MSVKSSQSNIPRGAGAIVKCGYLKKLKTSKRKYFVLRAAETCESSARLEYYDSEKKFNNGQLPKRSIPIKTCFNINKRHDMKHNKHVIALYTKDDCFCVALESEEESDAWLKELLAQQQGEEVPDGVTPRPTFEHTWKVQLLNRGISTMVPGYKTTSEVVLTHCLCLTDKTLSLIKQEENNRVTQTDFPLTLIRSCGCLKNYFYLEAGRSSVIGAGEIWMEAEDAHIASNIYHTVFNTMNSSSSREEFRNRSSSADEASKPKNMPRRLPMPSGGGPAKPMPSSQQVPDESVSVEAPPCSSLANNNNCTTMTATTTTTTTAMSSAATAAPTVTTTTTGGNIAWPGIVNHQRTRSLPLAHPAPITTDNPIIHAPKAAKRPTPSSKCADPRARADSMPSRSRNNSHPQLVRDISHSPPSDSPVSPPSVGCSTDSTGSSLSIDDSESWHDPGDTHRRFPISLTPDEAIAEENCDDCADSPCALHSSPTPSYVPMSHVPSDDGYVDMSPRARHITMSPAPSLSSVTSGTPSTTDMRMDYPLEKVFSYIPSEDEETSSHERLRTYSMDSYRNRVEPPRNRACSFGSKTKKGYNRVLPPHGHNNHNGAKSSSAPILSNNRLYSSHSSIDPMEDLMEMDFSRKPSDYVEMSPASRAGAAHTAAGLNHVGAQNANNKIPFGYVDMRPGAPILIEKLEPAYMDMKPGTSPNKSMQFEPARSVYLEMDGRANKMKPSTSPQNPSLSPLSSIASTSPLSQYTPTTDYMDMNFHPKNNNLEMYIASPARSTLSYINQGSPSSIDYIDMDYHPASAKKENEGYVEMSLGGSGRTPTASSASDYTNMSFYSTRRNPQQQQQQQHHQQHNVKSKNENNTRSKPINIQQQPTSGYDMIKMMILPLGGLPKPRSRKNSRRDSRDSSSSSVTTPSSSSTIFPLSLNSPSSPVCSKSPETKSPASTPNAAATPSLAAVTSTATTTTATMPSSRIKVPSTVLNAKYQASGFRRDMSDYAPMNFERNKPTASPAVSSNAAPSSSSSSEQANYVNYSPSATTSTASTITHTSFKPYSFWSKPAPTSSPDAGDYALMQPGVGILHEAPGHNNSSRCFKPIDEEVRPSSRPSSESSEVSTLIGSRPSSVNSAGGVEATIPTVSTSAQGQQLHYASLDLAAPNESVNDDGSKSPRTPKPSSAENGGGGGATTKASDAAGFSYAEIDFVRSEGFKTSNALINARIKH